LAQSRVAGKVGAPAKDILATYDEIFAWGGDDEAKQEVADSIEAASLPEGEQSVQSNNHGEGNDTQVLGSEDVEVAAKVSEDDVVLTAVAVAAPGEDALLEDFMAELRKARERVTTEASDESSDGGGKVSPPANVSIENDGGTAQKSTVEVVELISEVGSKMVVNHMPAHGEEAKAEHDSVDIAIPSSDGGLQQQPKQIRRKPRRRHIKNMSVLAVSQNLKSMGLPYVAKVFEDDNIDGATAQFLDDDLLRNQLKILTVSERLRTMHWISSFY